MKDYFNTLVEDQDDLGDILFGDDCDEFEARVNLLDDNCAKEYADGIIDKEVIDKDELER